MNMKMQREGERRRPSDKHTHTNNSMVSLVTDNKGLYSIEPRSKTDVQEKRRSLNDAGKEKRN
jgi:hypothetical protein